MDTASFRQGSLARIEAYCAQHGLTEAQFGRLAVGDDRFVARLRDPNIGVTLTTMERADGLMAAPPPRQVRRRAAEQAAA